MLRKAGILFAFAVMGSVSVSAADTINFDNGVNISAIYDNAIFNNEDSKLDNALTQIMEIQQDGNSTPLAAYREQISRIRQPSYDVLLPVLQKLAVYNRQFSTIKDEQRLVSLASKIATLTHTGWNNYRNIGIVEIYDRYVPVNQPDRQIALLEYNIKKYSMTKEQIANTALLENMPVAEQFLKDFKAFSVKMNFTGKYNSAEIISAFVPVAKSYGDMAKKVPAAATLAKQSVFKTPIACGWGRTHTVEQLHEKLGIIWHGGGDALEYRTAENMQKEYSGLTYSDAAVFADFVSNYYKK